VELHAAKVSYMMRSLRVKAMARRITPHIATIGRVSQRVRENPAFKENAHDV
jgi:hypothetical protein